MTLVDLRNEKCVIVVVIGVDVAKSVKAEIFQRQCGVSGHDGD